MKRFTVAIAGGGGAIAPWLDTGFVDFAPGVDDAGWPLRPDVLSAQPASGWESGAAELWPKVIVLAAPLPGLTLALAEAYKLTCWRPSGLAFAVATSF